MLISLIGLFQGAQKEGVVRCCVADGDTFTANVFFSKAIEAEALADFDPDRVYAVELENLAVFDKAKHCASIVSYIFSRKTFLGSTDRSKHLIPSTLSPIIFL